MRSLTTARSSLSLIALLALLGACSSDTLAPRVEESRTIEAESPFIPSAASKALVGVTDGTYTFVVNPTQDQYLYMGANMLAVPANSVCDLETSSYGSAFWKSSCVPETTPVTITAVVTGASTLNPRIDFFPAMRFNPETKVSLYMYAPEAQQRRAARSWVVQYCDAANRCIDEAIADPSVSTKVDKKNKVIYRRIRHFSGFIVVSATDDGDQSAR